MESEDKSAASGRLTNRQIAYRNYFQALVDECVRVGFISTKRMARPECFCNFSSGVGGVVYCNSFTRDRTVRVEIGLEKKSKDFNKELFDWFALHKDTIEAGFGESLRWERMDENRNSKIALYCSGSIESDQQKLAEIRAWAVEKLIAFERFFGPLLRQFSETH